MNKDHLNNAYSDNAVPKSQLKKHTKSLSAKKFTAC